MGQPKQTEDEGAPVDEEYVPAQQLVHVPVPNIVLYLPAAQKQQVVPVPAPSQSVNPAAHDTWEVTTCARHRSRTPQSARGAPRLMTGVSNISDCVFIESIRTSPNTEILRRLGVVELAGEGDELLLLGLLPREGAAAGLGAGGEVDFLEGVVEALRGRVRAGDGCYVNITRENKPKH